MVNHGVLRFIIIVSKMTMKQAYNLEGGGGGGVNECSILVLVTLIKNFVRLETQSHGYFGRM